jgi:tetratricopeptide (TPR) repeat protein
VRKDADYGDSGVHGFTTGIHDLVINRWHNQLGHNGFFTKTDGHLNESFVNTFWLPIIRDGIGPLTGEGRPEQAPRVRLVAYLANTWGEVAFASMAAFGLVAAVRFLWDIPPWLFTSLGCLLPVGWIYYAFHQARFPSWRSLRWCVILLGAVALALLSQVPAIAREWVARQNAREEKTVKPQSAKNADPGNAGLNAHPLVTPGSVEAWMRQGQDEFNLGYTNRARASYVEGLRIYSQEPSGNIEIGREIHYELGRIYAALGDFEQSKYHYEQSRSLGDSPDSPP